VGLARFLGKRIVAVIISLAVMVAVAYLLIYAAPGKRPGGDEPLYLQVLRSVWNTMTLNFGTSFANPSVPIRHQLATALPISAILTVGSMTLAIAIGIPLGVVAALKRNTWIDSALTTLSLAGQAIPSYVLAVVLVLIFGVWAPGILPINGWGTVDQAVLPIIALSASPVGVITRYMRSSLVDTLRQDFIRTAEAKGVRCAPLAIRHALPNSLTALITVAGPTFAFTVVSAVWVEQIFSIPGVGRLMSTAFPTKDIPLSITSVFILSLMVMCMNTVVDLLYRVFDPRVALG